MNVSGEKMSSLAPISALRLFSALRNLRARKKNLRVGNVTGNISFSAGTQNLRSEIKIFRSENEMNQD